MHKNREEKKTENKAANKFQPSQNKLVEWFCFFFIFVEIRIEFGNGNRK